MDENRENPASRESYDRGESRESYAYPFLHNFNIKETFGDMKFDVIIGNPPYQLTTGSGGAQATPLYQKFVEKSISLNPKYINMIIPSRWFFGGMGLSEFREKMIKDKRMKTIVDYQLSTDCFPNMGINGGINYFLWDRDNEGKCEVTNIRANGKVYKSNRFLAYKDLDVFINDNILFNIIERNKFYYEKSNFSSLVSPAGPYGKLNSKIKSNKTKDDDVVVYGFRIKGYTNKSNIESYKYNHKNKLFISLAYGGKVETNQVLNKPFIPEEDAICSETYLSIGPFNNIVETKNALSYMKTKFFRAMVYALKKTQHGTQKVYRFVPLQDFSKSWTDEELYKKYGLTEEEIAYIEENIAPMTDDTTVSEDTTEEAYLDSLDESELEEEEIDEI